MAPLTDILVKSHRRTHTQLRLNDITRDSGQAPVHYVAWCRVTETENVAFCLKVQSNQASDKIREKPANIAARRLLGISLPKKIVVGIWDWELALPPWLQMRKKDKTGSLA